MKKLIVILAATALLSLTAFADDMSAPAAGANTAAPAANSKTDSKMESKTDSSTSKKKAKKASKKKTTAAPAADAPAAQ